MTGWEWNVGFTGFNLNADMAIYKVPFPVLYNGRQGFPDTQT